MLKKYSPTKPINDDLISTQFVDPVVINAALKVHPNADSCEYLQKRSKTAEGCYRPRNNAFRQQKMSMSIISRKKAPTPDCKSIESKRNIDSS